MLDSTIESESESDAEVDPVDDGGGERSSDEDGPSDLLELFLLTRDACCCEAKKRNLLDKMI